MTKEVLTLQCAAAKTPVKAAVDVIAVPSLSNITQIGLFLFVSHSPKNPIRAHALLL